MGMELILDREVLTGLLVGSSCVPILSFVAERFGTRVAGAGGGIPATMAASLFFLGLDQGPGSAAEAAAIIPLVESAFGFYCLTFLWLARRNFWWGLCAALAVWAGIALVPIALYKPSFGEGLLIFVATFIACFAVSRAAPAEKPVTAKSGRPSGTTTLLRMAVGGSVVALAVIMGKLGGPVLSALVAGFPTIVTATFVALYLSDGVKIALAFGTSLMLHAMLNTVIYAASVYFFYPRIGIVAGTILAMVLVSCSSTVVFRYQGGAQRGAPSPA